MPGDEDNDEDLIETVRGAPDRSLGPKKSEDDSEDDDEKKSEDQD